jgi:hypothetical protein
MKIKYWKEKRFGLWCFSISRGTEYTIGQYYLSLEEAKEKAKKAIEQWNTEKQPT